MNRLSEGLSVPGGRFYPRRFHTSVILSASFSQIHSGVLWWSTFALSSERERNCLSNCTRFLLNIILLRLCIFNVQSSQTVLWEELFGSILASSGFPINDGDKVPWRSETGASALRSYYWNLWLLTSLYDWGWHNLSEAEQEVNSLIIWRRTTPHHI